MATEYIIRKDVLDAAWHNYYPSADHYCVSVKCATRKDLEKIPAADVRPVVRGRWKDVLFGWECTACHKKNEYSVLFNFCPNCGADMREVKTDEK